jgi:sulfite exporter TauE/SafE
VEASVLAAAFAGLLTGVASLPHCAGMCGPLAAAACATPRRGVAYQLGRIVGYAALGAGAGGVGGRLLANAPAVWARVALTLSLAAALAVAALRAYRAARAADGGGVRSQAATSARCAGRSAVRPVPLRTRPRRPSVTARLLGRLLDAPLALGLATALLPCGALAAGVVVAGGTGSPVRGAAAMLGFGVAGAPALWAAAWAVARLRSFPLAMRGRGLRLAALALAVGALVTAVRLAPQLRALGHGVSVAAPCHQAE